MSELGTILSLLGFVIKEKYYLGLSSAKLSSSSLYMPTKLKIDLYLLSLWFEGQIKIKSYSAKLLQRSAELPQTNLG